MQEVEEGGHDIPKDVIKRRYYRGIENLFSLYHGLCDVVLIYDNSIKIPDLVYSYDNKVIDVYNSEKLEKIKSLLS